MLHLVAFFVTLVAGGWLVWVAQPRFRASVAIYIATLAAQFGTSATYHIPTWTPTVRQWFRRCDHATIFLLIAGATTPIAMAIDPVHRDRLLAVVWIGALVGVVRAIVWITAPKWLVAAIAVTLGSICFTFVPAFRGILDDTTIDLLIIGGITYILGAVAYAAKRPNFVPGWFGYHELFHALTIVAGACDFIAIWRVTHG